MQTQLLFDWVGAKVLAFAILAMVASPHIIELRHGLFDDDRVVGEDARFEVALVCGFHADAGTRQVRATNIHFLAVEYQHFKMHSWTQH